MGLIEITHPLDDLDNNCSLIVVIESETSFTTLLQFLNITLRFGRRRQEDGAGVFATRPWNFQKPILPRP
jgi:hypothetical protein